MKNFSILILVCCCIFLLYPSDAYAYLNPGSGSDFFQMIMSFFVGILAGIKLFCKKIKSLFIKSKEKDYE